MKRKNWIYMKVMVVVAAAVLLVLPIAAAQDTEAKKAQCKITDERAITMQQCKIIMNTLLYLDSPAIVLGQAKTLKLSAEQKYLLKKIEDDVRKKALGVLTPEQREKLGEIPAKPITLAQLCGKMPCGKSKDGTVVCPITGKNVKTCPADCTKPCCAVKPGVCPIGCTKPCCAVKSKSAVEQRTCPVMGGVINKNIFTEYKGKKVYFCCAGCKEKFEKEPEKYLDKLSQFKKSGKGEDMTKVLKITWQRLIDEKGQTCRRCGSTEKQLQKALQSLKESLTPLGIKVTLEKKPLDPATCAKDISQSNRIWVGERALEEWLGAKVGKSLCGFCCAELGDQVECRTVEIKGQVYETIPANLIVRAGLLAAADLYAESSAKSCCPGDSSAKPNVPPCCPVSYNKSKGNGNK